MVSVGRTKYEASYDKVCEEVMNSLYDCGFRVKKEDRESGEIPATAGSIDQLLSIDR